MKKDYTGQRFGYLTVIERLPHYKGNSRTYYRCVCDCGNEYITSSSNLVTSKNPSCGCVVKISPKRKDYTGQTFGKLYIQKMLYNYQNKKTTYAECVCDCGNVIITRMSNIVNGHTQSCGCYEMSSRFGRKNHEKDITGMRFGRLTVIEKTELRSSNSSVIWKCLCDCGNITYSTISSLRTGHTQSCGCYKLEYIENVKKEIQSGDRFGFLTIISEVNGCYRRSFLCQCDCGNTTIVTLDCLSSGNTTSCGCFHQSNGEKFIVDLLTKWEIEHIPQKKFNDCKNIKALPFDFYIPSKNVCIEYNGKQHYEIVPFYGGEEGFTKRQKNDEIKKKFCKDNNIQLVCLPYTLTKEEIETTLFDILKPLTTTAI